MTDLQKIAVVIDADNTQVSKMDEVLREISTRGRIVVKRAYGNWSKDGLKSWETVAKKLAIKAEQQFDYVSGKNATDMALVIDTIELLYSNIYDAFVIVSSDSDYTPLAIKLHESGVYVIGIGEKKTPESFRNACDEFLFLEHLASNSSDVQSISKPAKISTENQEEDEVQLIHKLLAKAFEAYGDEGGYTLVSAAGNYLKRAMPDFDCRTYGYRRLTDILNAFPARYELKKFKRGAGYAYSYRCLP